MQYDDGYVAYLNGVEIASENAPPRPRGTRRPPRSRPATCRPRPTRTSTFRFLNSATTGHLTATGNVLAIQVLMSSPTDARPAGRAGVGPDDERRRGRPHFLHAHAGRRQRAGRRAARRHLQHGARVLLRPVPGDAHARRRGAPICYTTDNTLPPPPCPVPRRSISSISDGGANDLTATVTCSNHGFYTRRSGSRSRGPCRPQYDGVFTITVTGPNTFTYAMSSRAWQQTPRAAMTAAVIPVGTVSSETINSITYGGSGGLTATASACETRRSAASPTAAPIATVTMSSADGFGNGGLRQQITGIAAASGITDGVFYITVTGPTTFTYVTVSTPTSNASGTMTATAGYSIRPGAFRLPERRHGSTTASSRLPPSPPRRRSPTPCPPRRGSTPRAPAWRPARSPA